jgi:hypothetical protein
LEPATKLEADLARVREKLALLHALDATPSTRNSAQLRAEARELPTAPSLR